MINSCVFKKFPIKGITNKAVEDVTFSIFKEALKVSITNSEERKKKKKNNKNTVKSKKAHKNPINHNAPFKQTSSTVNTQDSQDSDNLYDKFEYGMSDWD